MSDRRGKRKEKEKVVSKDATTNATMTWKSKNTMAGGWSGLTPLILEELRAKGLVSQLLGVRKIKKLSKTPQGVVVHTCESEPPLRGQAADI